MAIHKLQIDDFFCSDYELIAIHSYLEDYRLAYYLNYFLDIKLSKIPFDVEINIKDGKGKFTHFIYEDEKNDVIWNLIQNKSVVELTTNQTKGLFDDLDVYIHLIPEYKKADYILKVENIDANFAIKKTINAISKSDFITMNYLIDQNKLKSKNNLIF